MRIVLYELFRAGYGGVGRVRLNVCVAGFSADAFRAAAAAQGAHCGSRCVRPLFNRMKFGEVICAFTFSTNSACTDNADRLPKEYYSRKVRSHEKYSRTAAELHALSQKCHVSTFR